MKNYRYDNAPNTHRRASALGTRLFPAVGLGRVTCQLLILIATAFVLASCWGSGAAAPSPFQGTFAGTWTSTGPNMGTANVTITVGGGFTGTEVDTTTNVQGSVTGTLQNNGTFAGTVVPQGGNPVNASGNFQISQDGNTLSGVLTYGGANYTFTLTRQ